MLHLTDPNLSEAISEYAPDQQLDLETKLKLKIIEDLVRIGWEVKFYKKGFEIKIVPPNSYDKDAIRSSMAHKRNEYLRQNSDFIIKNINLAKSNLASGVEALNSKIEPVIEVCQTPNQHQLFRIFRCYWSSPYSDYVGRRIRVIIRDHGLKSKPVVGIAALGSPIIHIPERDEFIKWDKKTRTERLNYMVDAYIIGALPPYNQLLGGKLISYILASNEVRRLYEKKYKNQVTLISGKKRNKLAGIFTTSLFGNSSQYNRMKYKGKLVYAPIGYTKGIGTHHLSLETINLMQEFLRCEGIYISYKFGAGPNYIMRIIRTAGEFLGFDGNALLSHSFKRRIYFSPFAENTLEFLRGETEKLIYYNWTQKELVDHWKTRWLSMRLENNKVIADVKRFVPQDFAITAHKMVPVKLKRHILS